MPQPGDEELTAVRTRIEPLLGPGEFFGFLARGEFDPYLRKPSTRLLPERPRKKMSRGAKITMVPFLLLGLPDLIGEAVVEAIKWPFRRLGRLAHGKAMQGGWNSDAGRFVLEVFGAHWKAGRLLDSHVLAVTGHRLLVAVSAKADTGLRAMVKTSAARFEVDVACVVPRGQIVVRDPSHHPARQRRRVDLLFPDGSWVALRLPSARAARELEAALGAPPAGGFAGA